MVTKDYPEYAVWRCMKDRCRNPNNPSWKHYGGRGITVCQRWKDSFPAFYADMGPRTTPKHSIDRINNDGNYEPINCRWATWSEQKLNSRSGAKPMNLRGKKFGRLIALHALPKQPKRMTYWVCRCRCGQEVNVGIGHLRDGHTRSCGCLQREVTAKRNKSPYMRFRLSLPRKPAQRTQSSS